MFLTPQFTWKEIATHLNRKKLNHNVICACPEAPFRSYFLVEVRTFVSILASFGAHRSEDACKGTAMLLPKKASNQILSRASRKVMPAPESRRELRSEMLIEESESYAKVENVHRVQSQR